LQQSSKPTNQPTPLTPTVVVISHQRSTLVTAISRLF
jgi:hypothetical protein